jgi:hypothetical protein
VKIHLPSTEQFLMIGFVHIALSQRPEQHRCHWKIDIGNIGDIMERFYDLCNTSIEVNSSTGSVDELLERDGGRVGTAYHIPMPLRENPPHSGCPLLLMVRVERV